MTDNWATIVKITQNQHIDKNIYMHAPWLRDNKNSAECHRKLARNERIKKLLKSFKMKTSQKKEYESCNSFSMKPNKTRWETDASKIVPETRGFSRIDWMRLQDAFPKCSNPIPPRICDSLLYRPSSETLVKGIYRVRDSRIRNEDEMKRRDCIWRAYLRVSVARITVV